MPTHFEATRRLFQHKIDSLLRGQAAAGAAALDQCETDHARAVAYNNALEQYRRAAGEIGAECVGKLVTIAITESRPSSWVESMVNEIVGKPAVEGTRVLFHWLLTENRPAWPSDAVPLAMACPEVQQDIWLKSLRADTPKWLLPDGVEQCFRDGYVDHEADATERNFQAYIATAMLQGQSDIELQVVDAPKEHGAEVLRDPLKKKRSPAPLTPQQREIRKIASEHSHWTAHMVVAQMDKKANHTPTLEPADWRDEHGQRIRSWGEAFKGKARRWIYREIKAAKSGLLQ